jgi:outer membrane protein assembly factor BamB/type 1 glutamine amidotransferase
MRRFALPAWSLLVLAMGCSDVERGIEADPAAASGIPKLAISGGEEGRIIENSPDGTQAGPQAVATRNPIRKIVLIAGKKSHGPVGNGVHDYGWTVKLLKVMLDNSNVRQQVRVDYHLDGWPQDEGTLEDADTIMVVSDGRDGALYEEAPHLSTPERVALVRRLTRRGCGFMTFHFSTFTPDQYADDIFDFNGGYFDWETDGRQQWYSAIQVQNAEVQLATPAHPVSRGVQPFTMNEEYYYNLRFRPHDPRVTPIWVVPTLPGREPDGRIVAWAHQRPHGGRGFGTSCGHFYQNWEHEGFRRTLLNALVWTAGLDVPPEGVQARYYTHDEITAALSVQETADQESDLSLSGWPCWRGPHQNGHAASQEPMFAPGSSPDPVWRTIIDGRGYSSPLVRGSDVFLTTANDTQGTQSLVCLDRRTGQPRWTTLVHQGTFPAIHAKNSHASATPASDASCVYTAFLVHRPEGNGIWVSAIDLRGNIKWQQFAGAFGNAEGFGSSPVLWGSLVIVAADNLTGSFLTALDRETGSPVWRVTRENIANFATPIVARVAGREQLVVHGNRRVTSYDPGTGQELWHCEGPADTCSNTLVFDGERVYASGGYPMKELLAIRADGAGDVTESHIVWRAKKGVCYVPSMLLHEGLLFCIEDQGIATCYDAATGKMKWLERLGGNFSASPVLAGNLIVACSEEGVMHLFQPADRFLPVARNEFPAGILASPAVVDGMLFLRAGQELLCFGRQGDRTASVTRDIPPRQ